jgi:hypothetical protein
MLAFYAASSGPEELNGRAGGRRRRFLA